ncbi:MAG: site-2 protease family protein [Chloroflexi bacterium]|nr:site-2 protease family protein [Chloroflexota bacterium]
MGWSFPVARVAGIDIKIHITFFLIVILGAIGGGTVYGAAGAVFGAVLVLLLFLCVTLHELGHGIAARAFGIPVREIILLPLGGLALLGRNPSKAWHELVIAAAGPLVNVLIAGMLLLVTGTALAFGVFDMDALQMEAGAFPAPSLQGLLVWLLQANIMLVLFNLIPAFPLDGGRIFRATLAMLIGQRRATRIATLLGQGIAILLGIFGIVSGNFLLALVAVFIFLGAGQENAEGQARTMLVTMRVGDAYNRHALTLQIGDRVSKVVDYILTSYQPDFAVMQGGRPIGIVTRDDVLRALASDPRDLYVTGVMQRDIVQVPSSATLDEVRQLMNERSTRVVAVYEGDVYLGLVSIEDIAEAYAVLAFLQRQQEARRMVEKASPGEP